MGVCLCGLYRRGVAFFGVALLLVCELCVWLPVSECCSAVCVCCVCVVVVQITCVVVLEYSRHDTGNR